MITVIIPTFKRRDMLFFELDKIAEQSYKDVEIIVVNDDIQNDPTDEIVDNYPYVKYIKHPVKIGPGQKRQVGFEMAKGDYIYTPDDDDYLTDKDFFAKAVEIMSKDNSISFVSGCSTIKYEDEKDPEKQYVKVPIGLHGRIDGIKYLQDMQGKYQKPLSSFPTLFSKRAFEKSDFLNQIETSDVSLYMLACLAGAAFFIDDYVGVYRVHSRSLTTKKSSPVWINNVLRQKERILCKIENIIDNPADWWVRHIELTYRFYSHTSKSRYNKFKLILWIIKHSHGYMKVYKYLVKEIIRAVLNR